MTRSCIVVGGALANKARAGGEAWVRLSWVRGLAALGHDVHLVEQLSSVNCTNLDGESVSPERSAQVSYFADTVEDYGLTERSWLVVDDEILLGPSSARRDLWDVADASSLVNVSGHLRDPLLLERFERRILVDIDPGYTQFWYQSGVDDGGIDDHDVHVTIGENIGTPRCPIPTCGVDWIPVRQPVVLDDWPVVDPPSDPVLTTVANWRGAYGTIEYDGVTYRQKLHEFREVFGLPNDVDARFLLALVIHRDEKADLDALRDHRWELTDPGVATGTPQAFRAFVQASTAEFSVAQGAYVHTGSGWFSDRSVRYLASGRPVVVQDTGFADHVPTGDGLLSFMDLPGAVSSCRAVLADYERHAAGARAIAERYFGVEAVLVPFCERVGIACS